MTTGLVRPTELHMPGNTMASNGKLNNKIAAIVCLAAFLLLGIIGNIHTHSDHHRTFETNGYAFGLAAPDEHCEACRLLLSDIGKLTLTAEVSIECATIDKFDRIDSPSAIIPTAILIDCSRAPPSA